jgi:ABC transporter
MVFQDLALWPHMTVRENIEFGLRAKLSPEKQRRQRVKEMIDRVGLDDYLSAKPGELSGGQQQRVALVRTLTVAPLIFPGSSPPGRRAITRYQGAQARRTWRRKRLQPLGKASSRSAARLRRRRTDGASAHALSRRATLSENQTHSDS